MPDIIPYNADNIIEIPDSGDPREDSNWNIRIIKSLLQGLSSLSDVIFNSLRLTTVLRFDAFGPIMRCHTEATGTPTTDGFRISYEQDYDGTGIDFLVVEKTDGNATDPDGGIVFVMTGNDGIRQEVLKLQGDGTITISGNLVVSGTINGTTIP